VIGAANRAMLWGIVFWGSMSVIIRCGVWPCTILLNVHFFLTGTITLGEFAMFMSVLIIFSEYVWAVIWQASQFNLTLARVEEAYRYLFGDRDVVGEAIAAGVPSRH